MDITYYDFPVIRDNDRIYFHLLESVINSIDELSTMEIRRNLEDYSFRIALSDKDYIKALIKELNSFHNLLHLHIIYSKSIKSSTSIAFKIKFVI